MFVIRRAAQSDNEALIALDKLCSMGEAMTLAFDRAPDFFGRYKAYEEWTALVAEDARGLPVGTGGLALKTVLVGGRPVRAAYLMDMRVHPDWRRKGVAMAIGDAVRDSLAEADLEFAYAMILRGNEPSASLLRKRGVYTPLGSASLPVLAAGEPRPLAPGVETRPMSGADMGWLAERWEACTGSWSLALPLGARGLEELISERLGVEPADRLVVTDGGEPIGAAALWEYSRIMAMTFVRLPESIDRRLSPALRDKLSGGRPFHIYYPLPMVWRSLEDLPSVLTALLNHLSRKHSGGDRAVTLWVPLDPEGPLAPSVVPRGIFSVDVDVFGVAVRGELPKQGPYFIDPRDI